MEKLKNKFNIKFDQTLKIEDYNLNILRKFKNTKLLFLKNLKKYYF